MATTSSRHQPGPHPGPPAAPIAVGSNLALGFNDYMRVHSETIAQPQTQAPLTLDLEVPSQEGEYERDSTMSQTERGHDPELGEREHISWEEFMSSLGL